MKKVKLTILYAGILGACVLSTVLVLKAQTKPAEPKIFTFKFTQQQVDGIWYVLDNSTANHNDVKAVQKWFAEQFNAQLQADSTKPNKKSDTTSPKKK